MDAIIALTRRSQSAVCCELMIPPIPGIAVGEIGLVKQQAPQDLQRRAAGVNLALEARYGGPE